MVLASASRLLDLATDEQTTPALLAQIAVEGEPLATTMTGSDGEVADLRTLDTTDAYTRDLDRVRDSWTVTVADTGPPVDSLEPTLVLIVGGALGILIGGLVWNLGRNRYTAVALARTAVADLERTEHQFRALVQNLSDLIVVTDERWHATYVSPSVQTLLGYTVREVQGSSVMDAVHPEDHAILRNSVRGSATAPVELRLRHRNGEFRLFEGSIINLLDDEAVKGFVCTAHDVTERKSKQDRLAHDATHDPLTGLPNRVLLLDRLGHALSRSERDGTLVAVMFLDLDDFKIINDSLGHSAGDQVLIDVAGRLRAAARSSDTVARYGGDEFVIVCEDISGRPEAEAVAHRLRDHICEPLEVGAHQRHIGTSIGVVLAAGGQGTPDGLVRQADAAMYRAKQDEDHPIEVIDSTLVSEPSEPATVD